MSHQDKGKRDVLVNSHYKAGAGFRIIKSLELKIYKSESKDFSELSISDNITVEIGKVLYYRC